MAKWWLGLPLIALGWAGSASAQAPQPPGPMSSGLIHRTVLPCRHVGTKVDLSGINVIRLKWLLSTKMLSLGKRKQSQLATGSANAYNPWIIPWPSK